MYSEVGDYQGTVVNVSKSWLLDPTNQERLKDFIEIYQNTLQYMKANPEEIIKQLAIFYNLSMDAAKAVYQRLWGVDGLNIGHDVFNQQALKCVEMLFTVDTNIEIPNVRSWVLNDYIEKK